MFRQLFIIGLSLLLAATCLPLRAACGQQGVWLQVLGSGGPELDDGRASSGYLVWRDGHARILVDMGGGSLLRFEQSGAQLNDLDVILLSHLHVDHSADLPALVKAAYFTGRNRDLPIYGPTGNDLMPATTDFVQGLFGPAGVYRYLADYLDGRESYRLLPHDVEAGGRTEQVLIANGHYRVSAVPVTHGPVPALAWRVEIAGHHLVFSGDMSNANHSLAGLASGADILVAHHAIAEDAGPIARRLHMPPSVIGAIAAQAGVKRLLLSHRMNRTLGREAESTALVRRHYAGPLQFVDDLQCFRP